MSENCGCDDAAPATDLPDLAFGEDGEIIRPIGEIGPVIRPEWLSRPCAIGALDGSWLIEVEQRHIFAPLLRGALRIEVGDSSLRVSGDMYSRRSFPPIIQVERPPVVFPDPPVIIEPELPVRPRPFGDETEQDLLNPQLFSFNWYPAFPKGEYSWYFRSTGATYADGVLTVQIVRHLWNRTTQEFVSTDTGTLTLSCRRPLVLSPATTFIPAAQKMTGTLSIGASTSTVKATKTSSLYRGCRIEVDAMVNRVFPASATIGSGATATLASVYRTAGWDVRATTDSVTVPDDANLTNAELATLMTNNRQAVAGEDWRLWLFVGSGQGGLFGIMFDDDSVPREGAAGFADATLGNASNIAAAARNRPLDEVPSAFLRTLVHEAGHAFNLWHPKHDVHNPGIGTEIMNQTGDVIGFATTANPYPGNASFEFSDHDRTSLIHSPDPQVRPGWKNFGWGHGDLSSGLPAPVDVAGLGADQPDDGLVLTLNMASQAFVGEYVTAEVVLTNVSDAAREVTTLLTLSEGDLVFVRSAPDGGLDHVVDIAIGCGPRPMTVLQPGESVRNHVQVFFTNQGVTFTEPGRHTIAAQLAVDPVTVVRSDTVTIDVRTPASGVEVDISASTLTPGVGRAIALGDFADDEGARDTLIALAEAHSDTDTGAAGALVLANSFARSFTDYRLGTSRDADGGEAARFLELAVTGRSAARAVELAVTVASPTEKDAPVIADTLATVQGHGGGPKSKAGRDVAEAQLIASDFVAPEGR
ncbi:hypothetical protein QL996_15730 [Planococcus sp. APC 4015]|nr:hypothetical protein [Planococcus sp. APC 4015]